MIPLSSLKYHQPPPGILITCLAERVVEKGEKSLSIVLEFYIGKSMNEH